MDSDLEYIYEKYVELSDGSSYEEGYSDETVMMQRFRMHKTVLNRLYHGVRSYDEYFILKKDVVGAIGFSSYQKCTATLRMLAYGTAADSWDKYLRMFESTCEDAMVRFATDVVEVFGPQYLREPTMTDTERLLAISKARGWPCLLRSLDCMH
ncbi:uncharacterized protein [Aegilops tauschii subsp. strangulata]|uniref:uncharacterized protein n=1 Tax=Aegilops tauschii subsp. strangulata TaxID=200361 RepID=UPI003CC849D0